jgi:hypothetical protein
MTKPNSIIANLVGKDQFQKLLNDASYHYADDSGGEWSRGSGLVVEAAKVAIENKWRFWQIQAAHREGAPLVTFDQVMEQICNVAYRGT